MSGDRFANKRQREHLAVLSQITTEIDNIEKDPFFKVSLPDFRRARTYLSKALAAVGRTLNDSEEKKFNTLLRNSFLKLVDKNAPRNDLIRVSQSALYRLAERAIGKECVGCEKMDWKKCELRTDLMETWIPTAQDNCRKECQFKQ